MSSEEASVYAPRRYIPPIGAPTKKAPCLNTCTLSEQVNNPNLCKVELKRVVRAQANVEPCLEEIRQGIPLKREEQRVIAQRAHGDADLFEVE